MVWHLKKNRAMHERLFVLTVETESVPRVRGVQRITVNKIAPNFWRALRSLRIHGAPGHPRPFT